MVDEVIAALSFCDRAYVDWLAGERDMSTLDALSYARNSGRKPQVVAADNPEPELPLELPLVRRGCAGNVVNFQRGKKH
jgi:hypothetical protein